MPGAKEKQRVPVTARAVIQRINRRLADEYGKIGSPPFSRVQLKKTRGAQAIRDLGEYYLVDVYGNFIMNHHLDLEVLAEKYEALSPWERLVDNEEGGE